MTLKQVKDSLCMIQIIHNKDCSEYAEDCKTVLGIGEIYTIVPKKNGARFWCINQDILCDYVYHTFLLIGCGNKTYAVDMMHPLRVIEYKGYITTIQSNNPHTILNIVKGLPSMNLF